MSATDNYQPPAERVRCDIIQTLERLGLTTGAGEDYEVVPYNRDGGSKRDGMMEVAQGDGMPADDGEDALTYETVDYFVIAFAAQADNESAPTDSRLTFIEATIRKALTSADTDFHRRNNAISTEWIGTARDAQGNDVGVPYVSLTFRVMFRHLLADPFTTS